MLKKFLGFAATGLVLLVAAVFLGSGTAAGTEPTSAERGARANARDGDQGEQTAQDGKKKKGKKGSFKKGKKGKKGKGKRGGGKRGKGKRGKGKQKDATEEVLLVAPALHVAFDAGTRLEGSRPATMAPQIRQRHFVRALGQSSGQSGVSRG